jgi:hypothetical protein
MDPAKDNQRPDGAIVWTQTQQPSEKLAWQDKQEHCIVIKRSFPQGDNLKHTHTHTPNIRTPADCKPGRTWVTWTDTEITWIQLPFVEWPTQKGSSQVYMGAIKHTKQVVHSSQLAPRQLWVLHWRGLAFSITPVTWTWVPSRAHYKQWKSVRPVLLLTAAAQFHIQCGS